MTNENDKPTESIESIDSTVSTETDAQPRKLLLGKQVLRHLTVRSSIQTGSEGVTISRRCK